MSMLFSIITMDAMESHVFSVRNRPSKVANQNGLAARFPSPPVGLSDWSVRFAARNQYNHNGQRLPDGLAPSEAKGSTMPNS